MRIHLTGLGRVSGLQLSTAEQAEPFPMEIFPPKALCCSGLSAGQLWALQSASLPSPLMLPNTQKLTADPHQPGPSLNQKLCQFQKGLREMENSVPRECQFQEFKSLKRNQPCSQTEIYSLIQIHSMPLAYLLKQVPKRPLWGDLLALVCEFLDVVQLDIVKISKNAEFPLNQISLPSPLPPSSPRPTHCLYSSGPEVGLPRWHSDKESTCQCRRCEFDPWGGNIPYRRK